MAASSSQRGSSSAFMLFSCLFLASLFGMETNQAIFDNKNIVYASPSEEVGLFSVGSLANREIVERINIWTGATKWCIVKDERLDVSLDEVYAIMLKTDRQFSNAALTKLVMFFEDFGKTFTEDLLSVRREGPRIYIHFKDARKFKINLGLIKSIREFALLTIENSFDNPQSINLSTTGKPFPSELMTTEPQSAFDENWCVESIQRSTKLPIRLADFSNVMQVFNFLELFSRPEDILERLVFTKRSALHSHPSMREVSIAINNLPRNSAKMRNKLLSDLLRRIFSSMLSGFELGHYEALPYLSRIRFNQRENGTFYFGAFFPVDISIVQIEAELRALAYKTLLFHYMDFNEEASKWRNCLVFTGNGSSPSSFFQHPDGMHIQIQTYKRTAKASDPPLIFQFGPKISPDEKQIYISRIILPNSLEGFCSENLFRFIYETFGSTTNGLASSCSLRQIRYELISREESRLTFVLIDSTDMKNCLYTCDFILSLILKSSSLDSRPINGTILSFDRNVTFKRIAGHKGDFDEANSIEFQFIFCKPEPELLLNPKEVLNDTSVMGYELFNSSEKKTASESTSNGQAMRSEKANQIKKMSKSNPLRNENSNKKIIQTGPNNKKNTKSNVNVDSNCNERFDGPTCDNNSNAHMNNLNSSTEFQSEELENKGTTNIEPIERNAGEKKDVENLSNKPRRDRRRKIRTTWERKDPLEQCHKYGINSDAEHNNNLSTTGSFEPQIDLGIFEPSTNDCHREPMEDESIHEAARKEADCYVSDGEASEPFVEINSSVRFDCCLAEFDGGSEAQTEHNQNLEFVPIELDLEETPLSGLSAFYRAQAKSQFQQRERKSQPLKIAIKSERSGIGEKCSGRNHDFKGYSFHLDTKKDNGESLNSKPSSDGKSNGGDCDADQADNHLMGKSKNSPQNSTTTVTKILDRKQLNSFYSDPLVLISSEPSNPNLSILVSQWSQFQHFKVGTSPYWFRRQGVHVVRRALQRSPFVTEQIYSIVLAVDSMSGRPHILSEMMEIINCSEMLKEDILAISLLGSAYQINPGHNGNCIVWTVRRNREIEILKQQISQSLSFKHRLGISEQIFSPLLESDLIYGQSQLETINEWKFKITDRCGEKIVSKSSTLLQLATIIKSIDPSHVLDGMFCLNDASIRSSNSNSKSHFSLNLLMINLDWSTKVVDKLILMFELLESYSFLNYAEVIYFSGNNDQRKLYFQFQTTTPADELDAAQIYLEKLQQYWTYISLIPRRFIDTHNSLKPVLGGSGKTAEVTSSEFSTHLERMIHMSGDNWNTQFESISLKWIPRLYQSNSPIGNCIYLAWCFSSPKPEKIRSFAHEVVYYLPFWSGWIGNPKVGLLRKFHGDQFIFMATFEKNELVTEGTITSFINYLLDLHEIQAMQTSFVGPAQFAPNELEVLVTDAAIAFGVLKPEPNQANAEPVITPNVVTPPQKIVLPPIKLKTVPSKWSRAYPDFQASSDISWRFFYKIDKSWSFDKLRIRIPDRNQRIHYWFMKDFLAALPPTYWKVNRMIRLVRCYVAADTPDFKEDEDTHKVTFKFEASQPVAVEVLIKAWEKGSKGRLGLDEIELEHLTSVSGNEAGAWEMRMFMLPWKSVEECLEPILEAIGETVQYEMDIDFQF